MQSEGVEKAERYSSGGLVSGFLGIGTVLALLVFAVLSDDDGFAPWAFPALLLAAVLMWAVLLRPAVVLHPGELELRNVLHSRFIPYPLMTDVQVKQVTVVEVGDERFVGAGLGRSRGTMRSDAKAGPDITADHSIGWLVEEKVRRRMNPHDPVADPGPVRRVWALPEVGAIAVLAVVTLVLALVA
ncbi:hypothetical protein [Nocardioides sp. J54]|uniref:hypothetical protein n=1 Tax=Nocardioides sp. J54 TaxID=935866 RepID=UPI00048D2D77|nr:hypothetical protein [Nocardioides sp. J54]